MPDVFQTITGGFFDSVNQDRLYSADQMNMPYKKLIMDGIILNENSADSPFEVAASGGMTVNVGPGNALIGGKWAENEETIMVEISGNTSGAARIDSIILRIDKSLDVRAVGIVYRQGAANAPDLEASADVKEFRLANITVANNAASITAANITDTRGGSECPYVTSIFDPPEARYIIEEYNGSELAGAHQTVKSAFDTIRYAAQSGQPTVVLQAADMTEYGKVYLYEGSEDGYDTGYLYYYSATDSAWIRGAQYGASVVDTSLDANSENPVQNKAVAAAFAEVNGRLQRQETLLNYEETTGINKLDPSTILSDSNIENNSSYANYGQVISGTYNVSDFIPVNGGDTVSWFSHNSEAYTTVARTTMFRIAEYDENKAVKAVSGNWAASPYTVSADTRFVRVVLLVRAKNMVVLNTTETSLTYEEYTTTGKLERIDNIENGLLNVNRRAEALENKENPFEVILPSAVYGVTGQQINVYKQNLMLHNRLKSLAYIHTRIEHSYQNDERTIWTPTATALTEYTRNVEVFANGFGSSYAAYIPVKFYEVPKDTGSRSIKALIIGDSKVDNGYVSYHFLHNFDDDNMTCTLLGTKYDWTEDNRNEGYGGKTAEWFCVNSDSPLSNNGVCDFAHYLSANNIATPDYVFINLGTNDCASKSSESDVFPGNYTTYISQMIDSIHTVSSDIVVIIGMCEGTATVKDTNAAEFLKWDINEKISRLHKVTVELYDNRQNENIYVCPMYMGMDLTQDYNMREEPLSSRDGDLNTGKTRMFITDHIHQNEVGYWKNADYMYALVKYIEAKNQA